MLSGNIYVKQDLRDENVYNVDSIIRDLINFPFQKSEEIGKELGKYNGAKRYDYLKVIKDKISRTPHRYLAIIEQLSKEACIFPAYGLQVPLGSRKEYVHFLLELNNQNSVGVFYFNTKRMLAVNQIHKVERIIKAANLTGSIVIANSIGIPAKQEAARINEDHGSVGIITIEQFSSIAKRRAEIF